LERGTLNLALYGRSGSGKSFVASILESRFGYVRVSTGELCRAVSRILFGNEDKHNLNQLSEKLKEIDDRIWIQAALREVDARGPIVFDSIRYISDHVILTGLEYKVVKISSDSELLRSRLVERGQEISDADFSHRSEWEVDSCNFYATIMNDGTSVDQITRQLELIVGYDRRI
jgi:dephospho-CoA kinase